MKAHIFAKKREILFHVNPVWNFMIICSIIIHGMYK
jgi:hypothetical protein